MGVILIAFERESEQSALERLLSGRGHRVVRSGNGLAALESARRAPPSAVVSDIVLPRMDGFALCRKWKQDERLQSIPFVFYTRRHDDPKYERFALELGAERFLARSMPPEELLATLDELLANVPAKTDSTTPMPDAGTAQRAMHAGRVQQVRALEQARQVQQQLEARVAELEATNERLMAGEARFRQVFEGIADGCWVLDADGRLLDVNAAYCSMSGYGRDELLGKAAAQIEEDSAGETTMRLQLGRPIGGGRYETKHRRRNGGLLDVEVSVGLLGAKSGNSVVLIRDVSQRRRDLVARRGLQRQLEFLVDLFTRSEALDEAQILRHAIEQAAEATASPLAWLFFVDASRGTMEPAGRCEGGQWHAMDGRARPRPLPQSELFTQCLRSKQAALSNDQSVKNIDDDLPGLQRYVAVPMVAGDETIAVLGVANRRSNYGEQDRELLAVLAEGVWSVIQGKRAHAQTLRSLQRTDVALQGMIDSFVRMGERHDPYTAGSARRLAALAVALGREAGLDGQRQHALRVAALLHDVGNIVVPAPILSKPGPLTATELALMRTHVEAGCELLADIDFGAPVADIIYQSHERCDGSGYPRGLKGEVILLEARILAIADTVEAMCSPRPYRPAAGMAAALDEIERGAGRLYDPQLVAACTRLVRQHGFSLPE